MELSSPVHLPSRFLLRPTFVSLASAALLAAAPATAQIVVSFGIQGGQATTETLEGTAANADDAALVGGGPLAFDAFPVSPPEDIDAVHVAEDGVYFSTTTPATLSGTPVDRGDVAFWDADTNDVTVVFSASLFTTPLENVDAVAVLPDGTLLISTDSSATLFGLDFLNGDVVRVDLGAPSATIFNGMNEATLFTGTNHDIDALHYAPPRDEVVFSTRSDGAGTVGGMPYTPSDALSSDLVAVRASDPANTGRSFLQGDGLFDGNTRQLDAASLVPTPVNVPALDGNAIMLLAGVILVLALRYGFSAERRRGAAD